jgi:pimeloyl-ACP methyl ester carboxylesterase
VTDRAFTRPGAQLACTLLGEAHDAPLVISAHGLSSSRANDELLGLSFEALSEQRPLLRYDARAHGASSGRPIAADYSWSALADDLLALADEFSPDAPVDAVGASMGCGTILHAAVRRPDRFRRLVLVIPPTAWETRAVQAAGYQTMAGLVEQRGVDAFVELAAGFENPPAMPAGLVLRPAVSEELLPTVFRGAALADFPPADEVARIAAPVLILAWSGDPGHPLSTAERLARLLPTAELSIAESPSEVARWVGLAEEFLAR